MEGRPAFDGLAPERLAAARRNLGAMRSLMRSSDPFPDLERAAVAAIAAPILLLQGERTSALHRCVIDELAGVSGSASRAVIAEAGHGPAAENPDAFNAAVLDFLEGVSARRGVDAAESGLAVERSR
jgi:pimeloyl-ACP methyl ester carboxylesterase